MSLMLPGEDKWPLYMSMIFVTTGGQLPELHAQMLSILNDNHNQNCNNDHHHETF